MSITVGGVVIDIDEAGWKRLSGTERYSRYEAALRHPVQQRHRDEARATNDGKDTRMHIHDDVTTDSPAPSGKTQLSGRELLMARMKNGGRLPGDPAENRTGRELLMARMKNGGKAPQAAAR